MRWGYASAGLTLALVTGCARHHFPVPVDGTDGGSAVPFDAGTATADAGAADAAGIAEAGPYDAGAPRAECLLGPETPATDGLPVVFTATPGPLLFWRDAVAHEDRLLVTAGSMSRGCIALLRDDLTVSWSTNVPLVHPEHYEVAALGSGSYLFLVGPGLVRWFAIDTATGALGPERTAPGHSERFEWIRIGGSPEGGFLVVWNEGTRIEALGYDGEGEPLGDISLITTDGRYPEVSYDRGRWLLGYHQLSSGAVMGPVIQAVGPNGSPTGGPVYPEGLGYGGKGLRAERTSEGLVAAWAAAGGIRHGVLDDALRAASPRTIVELSFDGTRLSSMDAAMGGTLVAFWDLRTAAGGVGLVAAGGASSTITEWALPARQSPMAGWAGTVPVALWEEEGGMRGMRLPMR
jgi:hypothetical protein